MDTRLAKNILATLTYYDVLDFPMTAFEVWRHLLLAPGQSADGRTWRLADVFATLRAEEIQPFIARKKGFFMLTGREELVAERMRRDVLSTIKIKKLVRYTKYLRFVPFVRMIALTGRLSYKNGEASSDLDVLVAFAHGHIWTGRFLMTAWTHLLGIRRYGKHHADRVCLNYYITDTALTVPTQDLYAAHEYSFALPLFGTRLFNDFAAANRWITAYKPHYIAGGIDYRRTCPDHSIARLVRALGEKLFGGVWMERHLRDIQRTKILANPKTQLPGAMIIVNDDHLVFLPKPHGPRVFEEYRKRFDALEVPWR